MVRSISAKDEFQFEDLVISSSGWFTAEVILYFVK